MSRINPILGFYVLGSSEGSRAGTPVPHLEMPSSGASRLSEIPRIPLLPIALGDGSRPRRRGGSIPALHANFAAVHTMYRDGGVAGPPSPQSRYTSRERNASTSTRANGNIVVDAQGHENVNAAFPGTLTRLFEDSALKNFSHPSTRAPIPRTVANAAANHASYPRPLTKESQKKDSKKNIEKKKRSSRDITRAEWRYLVHLGRNAPRGHDRLPYPATAADTDTGPATTRTVRAFHARAEHEDPATTAPVQEPREHIDSPTSSLSRSLIEAMRPASAPPFIPTVQHRPADRARPAPESLPNSNGAVMDLEDSVSGTTALSTPGQHDKTIVRGQHTHEHVEPQHARGNTGNLALLEPAFTALLPPDAQIALNPSARATLSPTVEASLPHGSVPLAFSPYPNKPSASTPSRASKRKSPDTESSDLSERWKRSRGVSPESRIPTPKPVRREVDAPDAILSYVGVFIPASGELLAPVPVSIATYPDDSDRNRINPALKVRPLFKAHNVPALISAVQGPTSRRVKRATVDLRPLMGTRLLAFTTRAYVLVTRKGDKCRISIALRDTALLAPSLPAAFAPFAERDFRAYVALSRKSVLHGDGGNEYAGPELKMFHGMKSQSRDFTLGKGREFRVAVRFPRGRKLKVEIAWVDMDKLEGWRGFVEN